MSLILPPSRDRLIQPRKQTLYRPRWWMPPEKNFIRYAVGSRGGASAPSHVLADTDFDNDSLTVYTFSGVSLGGTNPTRLIIVVVHAEIGGGGDVTGVDVAGVAATRRVFSDGLAKLVEIWTAEVPAGLTGDVEVTFDTAAVRAAIGVYAAYNLNSSIPTDTDTDLVDNVTDRTSASLSSLTVNTDGFGIAAITTDSGTFGWSGADEDYDGLGLSATGESGASVPEGSSTITASFSSDNAQLIGAAWR